MFFIADNRAIPVQYTYIFALINPQLKKITVQFFL